MKPDKFDGKESYETFVYQFENCAKYNGWSLTDKVSHLRWSLSGPAAQLLWGTEDLEYVELIEKLRNRYGGKGMEEKYQNELRCRRRSKGESLRELSQDIQRLMALAYPGEKSTLSEHIARDAFLSSLDDPELELKVREREPTDLDGAVKLAQRFEVFKSTVESSFGQRHRTNRQVIEEMAETVVAEDLGTRMLNIERQLQDVRPPSMTNARQPQQTGDSEVEVQSHVVVPVGRTKKNR